MFRFMKTVDHQGVQKFFKNLIVDFKIDWFVLTVKYSNPYKRMFKSFSSG